MEPFWQQIKAEQTTLLITNPGQQLGTAPPTGVTYHTVDENPLPFASEQFDQVILWRATQATPWPRALLQEAARVTRTGGYVTLYAQNRIGWPRLFNPVNWLKRARALLRYLGVSAPKTRQRQTYLSLPQLQQLSPDLALGPATITCRLGRSWHTYHASPLHNRAAEFCLTWPKERLPERIKTTIWQSPKQFCQTMLQQYQPWFHPEFQHITSTELPLSQIKGPVLLLAPHPDDELVGSGGTLLALRAHGVSVHVLHMSHGSSAYGTSDLPIERRKTERLKEAERVAQHAGFIFHSWPDVSDGTLCSDNQLLQDRLEDLIGAIQPQTLFMPHPADHHEDHTAASQLAVQACRALNPQHRPQLLGYQGWGTIPPHYYVEITPYHAQQMALLHHYYTALKPVDYIEQVTHWQAYYGLTLVKKPVLIEIFAPIAWDGESA
ncbi:PIG-L family deacetylase [Magnetococcus sp. PR-3]|uniref:PIG-L family deacetylase n=1 Tax=Magnetococcus sp. PR-3 TaxID=3120355 RepID=UPI002FCE2281